MKPGADSVTRITIMGSAVIRKLDGTVLRIPEDLPGYQCRPRQSAFAREFLRQELVDKAEADLRESQAGKRKARKLKPRQEDRFR